jgi:hypothetical protein
LNLENSQLNLSGWFGVLFINVFGNWFGNFGVYHPVSTQSAGRGAGDVPMAQSELPTPKPVFQFVQPHPATPSSAPANTGNTSPLIAASAHLASATGEALGSSIQRLGDGIKATPTATAKHSNAVQVVGGAMVAIGLTTLGIERVLSARAARKVVTTL